MLEVRAPRQIFVLFILIFTLLMINEMSCKSVSQETNPEAFRILKQESINPKTGLPRTLDSSLFRGKAKQAYQVAREIPEILAQIPCFCECEAYGHENLLDCFIDNHGAG